MTIETPFTISESDKAMMESRINDLNKYESRITQVNVFFKKDDGSNMDDVSAEIRIRVPGNDIFVGHSDRDALVAFSKAYSSAKRQVKKRRDMLNDHHSNVREINEIVNNTY